MDMKLEQEDRFRLLVQAQDEDRRAIRSLLGREETPVAAPSIAHAPLMRMGPHDDPEAFVDLFEKTAEACGWARSQWPVRLIPLLTGEAQVAAQQLPVANLLAYEDLKRAILQRVGRNPEQHRQRFRSMELGDYGRPFMMAQQLRDACRKWLLAEPRDVEGVIEGGAGAVRRPTTPANGRVGPVPPPGVAGPGHPAGGGPSVGVPRGRRAPA